ncbi:MAG: hypothetical protein HFE51_09800 [Clostridia bacterium]|nr:hypothetical protein [Clostridia bacterium]NDO20297.1 hypothetical protein [Lachnospiraceae bacterium MD329]
MINTYLFGQTFYTRFGQKKEIVGSKKYSDLGECYQVNPNYPEPARDDRVGCDIVTEEDMHDILSKQPEYIVKYKERQKREAEYKIQLELQEKKRREEEAILEMERDLYGFLDGKTPMMCGKIQMVLQKKFVYRIHTVNEDTDSCDAVQRKYMSRKNFVIQQMKNGYAPKNDNGKYMLCKMIDKARGYVYYITKVEYDFGMYLLDNGILEKI